MYPQSLSILENVTSDIFFHIYKCCDYSPLSSLIYFAQYLLTPILVVEDLALLTCSLYHHPSPFHNS